MNSLNIYYENFKGSITFEEEKNRYITKGVLKKINNEHFKILELPIKKWTDDYKNFLIELKEVGI
jgi:DNA topoisomerase-2